MSEPKSASSLQPITRMTIPMLAVLAVLLDGAGWYGLRIAEATALRTGTVYPILARFERAGWVTGTWESKEDPDKTNDSGARRKYYKLTPDGEKSAKAALELRREALAKPYQVPISQPGSVFGH